MSELIKITENGIHIVLKLTDDGRVRLLHMSTTEIDDDRLPDGSAFSLVQVKTADYGFEGHHGAKHITAGLSERLRYVSHTDTRSEDGTKRSVAITQQADDMYGPTPFGMPTKKTSP